MAQWRKRARDRLLRLIIENDGEEEIVVGAMSALAEEISEDAPRQHGGSLPGKRGNIDRGNKEGAARIHKDYFAPEPTYRDDMFEQRYRLPREVFLRAHYAVLAEDIYFVQKRDALGVQGKSPLQKTTAAMRMLGYGASADSLDEYCRLSETVAMESLKKFTRAVEKIFGE